MKRKQLSLAIHGVLAVSLLASVPVIDIFLDEESQGLAMLSEFIGKPISLKAEPSYGQEQYDIVLL